MTGVARTIEQAGYESLWVYDHFHTVPLPTQEVTYEAWTLMAALAVATDTVRIGQMCTCNTYRPPSYLAKVAASIDVISGGRLEMGIGAGWYEHEHDGYGYPFLKPSERIGMLREGVEIMKAMWTEDEVNYDGKYYQLKGAISQPKPLQDPHIPFWIAGGGERLTLNIAARHAQYTNFGVDLEEFAHKSNVLEGHCDDIGTDYSSIVRSSNFNVFCTETENEEACMAPVPVGEVRARGSRREGSQPLPPGIRDSGPDRRLPEGVAASGHVVRDHSLRRRRL
jgi:F420-dependent oxidoreductase-like protein